jgi:hypothetical protein
MNEKAQNQSIIPPLPPLAKGGWGDLTFELDLNFEL